MILVTGSSGLVGSHLLYNLLLNGEKVKALIRNEESIKKIRKVFNYYTNNTDALLEKLIWQEGDITDFSQLEEIFENVQYVYHCAAVVSFNKRDSALMADVNIQGTSNIVRLCLAKGVKKLVHISSIAAIAKATAGDEFTEEGFLPQGKLSSYSYSKTQSELKVWQGIAEGLNAVILNPSVILGPGDWNSGSGKIFAQADKGMKFYTLGTTGFVDVRDVAKIMIALMTCDIHSERFIVSAENLSYKDLFSSIANELGIRPPTYYASSFLTGIAWRIEKLVSILLFRKPTLTKQAAKTSHSTQKYSSEKLIKWLGFEFMPIKQTISHATKCFLKDKARIT